MREPSLCIGGECFGARLAPRTGVDLTLARGKRPFGFASARTDRFPLLLAVDVVDDREVAASAFDDRSSCHPFPPISELSRRRAARRERARGRRRACRRA